MTALTEGRNTVARSGDLRNFPLAAGAVIFPGALAALDASGNLVPGSTATTLKAVGRAESLVDNTGGAAGDQRCEVGAGIFQYANSAAGDLIAAADIGANCFIVDDQTVAKTDGTGTRSVAGKIYDVDAQGVWVQF